MANNYTCNNNAQESFREAVCIDTKRIYDSCCDKDCLEDLRVYFTPDKQAFIDQAMSVRVDEVEVITAKIDVEPVQYNKGFYTVDVTYYFAVTLDVFACPGAPCQKITGLSIFNKQVILYGSCGNVKIFSSEYRFDAPDCQNWMATNLPRATVQVANPVALSAKICEKKCCDCDLCCTIPQCVCKCVGSEFACINLPRYAVVTIGLFTIVSLERDVQLSIPVYDFCLPEKECTPMSDSPCDLFAKINFPVDQFFPPADSCDHGNDDNGTACGTK